MIRQKLFGKRRKFADLDELNQWLRDECKVLAARQKHPDFPGKTVAEVAELERESLVQAPVTFDAYQAGPARVSPTSLVNFDRNRYSVEARCTGKIITVRAYADRVSFHHDGKMTTVLLDRVTHHCEIIETGNESWRIRTRKNDQN